MKKLLLCLLTAGLCCLPLTSQACTIYAAQGAVVADGGTLIGKNRDFKVASQELRVVKTGKYAYYGLFGLTDKGNYTLRCGVNEKGLVIVSAMTSCIPKTQRQAYKKKATMRNVLTDCQTVEEALARTELYLGPKFLMLADAKEIACVEVGEDGQTSVNRTKNSSLAHTNFYLDDKFGYLNIKVGESSKTRYKRITQLLADTKQPYTLDNFIAFSQDQSDGPDNSLWRVGSTEQKEQTLAAFIVHIARDGNFKVWIKYRPEPEDKGNEEIVELTRDEIFG